MSRRQKYARKRPDGVGLLKEPSGGVNQFRCPKCTEVTQPKPDKGMYYCARCKVEFKMSKF